MNDYGFVTYDEKTGKKKEVSINSRLPIFGPKYSDIKNAFKTVHITDTKQYTYRTSSSVTLPSVRNNDTDQSVISQYHGYERILVATIPHNFGYRPVGYVTISGTYLKNTRSRWVYTRTTDYFGSFSPSATLYGTGTSYGNMQNTIGGLVRDMSTQSDIGSFEYNNSSESKITYPSKVGNYVVQEDTIPGNNSSVADAYGVNRVPYQVEIDDNNVYLYSLYYWSDTYRRFYQYSTSLGRVITDIRSRRASIIDYAGSQFDLTIYLCPYKMENLL